MSARRRHSAERALMALAALGIGATLAGLGPRDWWLCDLLANLRLHAIAALLLLLPLLAIAGHRRLLLATAASTAAALVLTVRSAASFDIDQQASASELAGPASELTVVSYNLGPTFRRAPEVLRYFSAVPGDVLILQEYSFAWHEALAALTEIYPHAVKEPRDGPFGIAMLSRLPLTNIAVTGVTDRQIPLIAATADVDKVPLDLIGLHLEWPMLPAAFATRNEQLRHVRQLIENTAAPTDDAATAAPALMVCGDWNMTPWSRWYTGLLAAGLHDGRAGWRPRATWPSSLAAFGIPIDHCFASPQVVLESRRIGPPLGSDHRPIVVRAALPGAVP